jgi:uncharacterized protein
MRRPQLFTRHIAKALLSRLAHAPVVLLQGARQTGKSTLAKAVAEKKINASYQTLDDAVVLSSASIEPQDFVTSLPVPAVIDEVQLVPELFRAIKLLVDRNRRAGMFLLTGSANSLLLPRLSESLVGRMQIVSLWPLSQGEIEGRQEKFLERIITGNLKQTVIQNDDTPTALRQRIMRGGYPEPVKETSESERRHWFGSYITTIIQRDIRELAALEKLRFMPNLLSTLAYRAGGLLNATDVANAVNLSLTTTIRYLTIFESTFLLVLLPAWTFRPNKRLLKSKKIYLADTGLLSHLIDLTAENAAASNFDRHGALLENFCLMELIKQASWHPTSVDIFHFRTDKGVEVDFVLEDRASGKIVGIEVKSGKVVRQDDLRGLNYLEKLCGDRFLRGIVLYTGDRVYPLGRNKWAIPVSGLWRL